MGGEMGGNFIRSLTRESGRVNPFGIGSEPLFCNLDHAQDINFNLASLPINDESNTDF